MMNDETVEGAGFVVSLPVLSIRDEFLFIASARPLFELFFLFLVFHDFSLVINQDLQASLIFLDC